MNAAYEFWYQFYLTQAPLEAASNAAALGNCIFLAAVMVVVIAGVWEGWRRFQWHDEGPPIATTTLAVVVLAITMCVYFACKTNMVEQQSHPQAWAHKKALQALTQR